MKVVSAEEMQKIDTETIQSLGIPGSVLMERAGLAVAGRIKEIFGRRRVIVISGSGNNGGDGLVVSRNLHNEDWDVMTFLISKPEYLKADALQQYRIASKMGVDIRPIEELLTSHPSILIKHPIIVDAILGTGLTKEVKGLLADVIRFINRLKIPVVSIDIPSGISSDNGQIMGEAVKAEYTVTFGLPKRGHLLYPGVEHTGELIIENIGFPRDIIESDKIKVELIEKSHVSDLLPSRVRYSHKGDYGHVLVIAGSKGKTGAALMTAKASLRCGAGLVTLGIPESLSGIFQTRVTEEMTLILPDKDGALSSEALDQILTFLDEKADVVAIGPGMGVSQDSRRIVMALMKNSTKPLVIDADGINSIEGGMSVFRKAKAPIIFTPHPGEMAKLLQGMRSETQNKKTDPSLTTFTKKRRGGTAVSTKDVEKDRITIAMSFAEKSGTFLVLKGVPTVIAAPEGRAFINPTGNPGMATAGTGDVLTGMIAGFLGQNRHPLNASITAVFLHGMAGDIAAAQKGHHSLIASDIIENIPTAIKSLKGHE
ncbi:MAG: NAD(P)H-hydrate dehydratase [Nitrospirota bacterium]